MDLESKIISYLGYETACIEILKALPKQVKEETLEFIAAQWDLVEE